MGSGWTGDHEQLFAVTLGWYRVDSRDGPEMGVQGGMCASRACLRI